MYINKISLSRVRPLPYYNIEGSIAEKRLATALWQEFVPTTNLSLDIMQTNS